MSEELFHGFEVIDRSRLNEYKQGVWAMFGTERKNNDSGKITCLNVGKNEDVGNELAIDFKCLKNKVAPKYKRVYVNQFGEKLFKYTESGNRQDELYVRINRKYRNIFVIFVSSKDEFNIEKYFAYSLRAKYWVSNGKYDHIVKTEEIERIRQSINIEGIDGALIRRINALKEWYDQQ